MAEDDPLARGRARVEGGPGGSRIVIPAKREWPLLLFLMVWLGCWTVGGVAVAEGVVSGDTQGGGTAFSLFWLGGWVLGLAFAASAVGWSLAGKEIVQVEAGALVVTRSAGPYKRVKRFARERIGEIRLEPYEGLVRGLFNARHSWRAGMEMWGLGGGAIELDYGARTHRFGSKLDRPEATQVAELIRRELRLG